jgi:DNA-binding CsgD family transcriptional regulator
MRKGLGRQEIAKQLGIHEDVVKRHMEASLRKPDGGGR